VVVGLGEGQLYLREDPLQKRNDIVVEVDAGPLYIHRLAVLLEDGAKLGVDVVATELLEEEALALDLLEGHERILVHVHLKVEIEEDQLDGGVDQRAAHDRSNVLLVQAETLDELGELFVAVLAHVAQ